MPIKHAAFKALRQNQKRHARNLAIKQALKKNVKTVRRAATDKNASKAKGALVITLKMIDRAAQKGVIKKNTAARLKSRLYKAVAKV